MTPPEPAKPYTEVESEFIKQEIADRDFEDDDDRHYINDLVKLEYFILQGPQSHAEGKCFGIVRRGRPDAYEKLLNELDPDKYERRKEKQRKRKERKQYKEKAEAYLRAEKLAKAREQWEKAQNDFDNEEKG